MVSLYKALSESPKMKVPSELEASSKKRKLEDPFTEEFFKDQSNEEKRKSIFGIELHLETPLPSQYLSIQSGHIHLCDTTRINSNAPNSSKRNREPEPEPGLQSHGQMSLDLELNLTYKSLVEKENSYDIREKKNFCSIGSSTAERDLLIESSRYKMDSPSWLSISEGDNKEMVATVCMRCHMLVMLCKLSPSCPNCKFMHPPDHNPSKFLNRRRCSLLC
ncbi:hypothetical protein Lal_00024876 [Lupinus albus]|uniref:Uncharacterized protein n=1 Tax=Lupinus albus TaxID=3870 RepID=A0A6A5NU40_LUPAL|nr:hypothetical protein Lalb_Chr10g0102361 [Lupinus albus]KAF1889549.1 hypothetical protein Lal_00024876 [Lupinus albus]